MLRGRRDSLAGPGDEFIGNLPGSHNCSYLYPQLAEYLLAIPCGEYGHSKGNSVYNKAKR